jgi:hypothetical protein
MTLKSTNAMKSEKETDMKKTVTGNHLITVDSFSKSAKTLRKEFESRFSDTSLNSNRFIWDYWHVPKQYTLLRTPAYTFFDKKTYSDLHNQIVWWGRRNLGCHDVSPTWLSCYVDGCGQGFHADVPHGPWAFVFSLTKWDQRKFTGGQTQLLNPSVLNYWQEFDLAGGVQEDELFELVDPEFNRLVVFDPRIPHAVKKVSGVSDVREGRLVIHGWFANPRPFIEGSLNTKELQGLINVLTHDLQNTFKDSISLHGVLSLGFKVSAEGRISGVRALSNSLKATTPNSDEIQRLYISIAEVFGNYKFKKQKAQSRVTLPLIFESTAK